MNYSYFSETFGLITKHDPTTENGGLFLAHYFVLRKLLGVDPTISEHALYSIKMVGAALPRHGLYLRSSHHTERTVSQDEMTGFFVASHILKTFHRFEIWEYLDEHGGNYPATGKPHFYNPGDYYPWALIAGDKFLPLKAILYTINLLITSCKGRQNTSGKLIYLDELFCIKDLSSYGNLLWKYYKWKMKHMYGPEWIREMYDIYFSTEDLDHPLRVLSREIKGI